MTRRWGKVPASLTWDEWANCAYCATHMTESLVVTWIVVLTMLVLCAGLGFFVGMRTPRA